MEPARKKVPTPAEQHEEARLWWKKKLESKTADNEKMVLQSFGCRSKCEEWVYGHGKSQSTDSFSKYVFLDTQSQTN